MIPVSIKKYTLPFLLSTLCVFTLVFDSCKKKHAEIADDLFKVTQNKVFKQADPDAYTAAFEKVLADEKSTLANESVIEAYYDKNDYNPVFTLNHLTNGDLDQLPAYLSRVNEHGLNPAQFPTDTLKALLAKLHDKKGIKTIEEGYQTVAKVELLSAGLLIKYSNALQFGVVNPKKIYSRYFMATKRPDSTSMLAVFGIKNMKSYLDSIQPKSPQYLALQKALKDSVVAPGLSKQESIRYYIVNLERLRWRNKPYEDKYVVVNLPDYRLDVMQSGKSVLNMKVCIGQGRNMDNQNTLGAFNDTAKNDKPYPKETPLLNSLIHSVQVNPVWNIPRSIATKEIIKAAADDRYYLSNKNIDVYKDGKKVDDPDSIDWSSVTKDNLQYEFKQRPGEDNSLGKIKFLFNNNSNVYLHDTPAKAAFGQSMRAVSHGCVRLGNPQGLAQNLFGDGDDYDTIAKDMNTDNPDPKNIDLPKKTPIYITYVTCWPDESGTLQYRKDVYGLDIVLYAHLQQMKAI